MEQSSQIVPWPCARCGVEFDRPITARGQAASWCRPCKRAYQVAYRAKRPDLKPKPGSCADCGGAAFGSRCRACYTKRREPAKPRPIGKPRPQRPPDSELTEKQVRNDGRMKALRQIVLGEEACCGICGDAVDTSLHAHHRMSATIDHIVPLALGGAPFDRSNVRLAHRSCNAKLGNRAKQQAESEKVALARAALWLGERLAA